MKSDSMIAARVLIIVATAMLAGGGQAYADQLMNGEVECEEPPQTIVKKPSTREDGGASYSIGDKGFILVGNADFENLNELASTQGGKFTKGANNDEGVVTFANGRSIYLRLLPGKLKNGKRVCVMMFAGGLPHDVIDAAMTFIGTMRIRGVEQGQAAAAVPRPVAVDAGGARGAEKVAVAEKAKKEATNPGKFLGGKVKLDLPKDAVVIHDREAFSVVSPVPGTWVYLRKTSAKTTLEAMKAEFSDKGDFQAVEGKAGYVKAKDAYGKVWLGHLTGIETEAGTHVLVAGEHNAVIEDSRRECVERVMDSAGKGGDAGEKTKIADGESPKQSQPQRLGEDAARAEAVRQAALKEKEDRRKQIPAELEAAKAAYREARADDEKETQERLAAARIDRAIWLRDKRADWEANFRAQLRAQGMSQTVIDNLVNDTLQRTLQGVEAAARLRPTRSGGKAYELKEKIETLEKELGELDSKPASR